MDADDAREANARGGRVRARGNRGDRRARETRGGGPGARGVQREATLQTAVDACATTNPTFATCVDANNVGISNWNVAQVTGHEAVVQG